MAFSFPKLEILRRSFPLLFEVKNQKKFADTKFDWIAHKFIVSVKQN